MHHNGGMVLGQRRTYQSKQKTHKHKDGIKIQWNTASD